MGTRFRPHREADLVAWGRRRCARGLAAAMLLGVLAGCGSLQLAGDRGALPDASQIAEDPASVLLLEAVARGRTDVALLAIDRGAKIEAREPGRLRTATMLAAERGNVDALTLLIAMGADLEARSDEGWMALHHGAANNRARAIRLLLAAAADPDGRESLRGMTPLMIASLLANTDAIAALLDGGASVDGRADDGSVALHFAASSRDREAPVALAELMVREAAPDRQRDDGWTPLMVAVAAGNLDAAGVLLDLGADPAATAADGTDALSLAAERGDDELIRRVRAALDASAAPAS